MKKGFFKEFKEFIMRGNVLDMAIGVIIASAFGKITTSLVNDVFMPFIGWLIGDFDLSKLNIVLSPEVTNAAGEVTKKAVTIGIGTFIVTVIDFLIIAFVVFMIIKTINKAKELAEKAMKKKEEEVKEEAPKGPTTEELLSDILAELKKRG
jgi:large conductance mechanosensitive channel